ncbi:MAG: hypothetical protein GX661_04775 [Acholeplasmataceae bacterium]|nr:hypothetical protein [Acholeplasmataceae bacterium]
MHYDLLIISKENLKHPLLKEFAYSSLDPGHYLVNPYETDNHLSFDYLIFDDFNVVKNIDIMIDGGIIITNCYFQTNYEHLFALGKINGSTLPLSEQLQRILEFLLNPN